MVYNNRKIVELVNKITQMPIGSVQNVTTSSKKSAAQQKLFEIVRGGVGGQTINTIYDKLDQILTMNGFGESKERILQAIE